MCRALTVVCVAADQPSLLALKRATAATEWELAPGATTAQDALDQIESRRAHVLVVWGPFAELVDRARERFPGLRIIAVGGDRNRAADASVASVEDVKAAVLGAPPRGPVRS
jgi:hypothetical protein